MNTVFLCSIRRLRSSVSNIMFALVAAGFNAPTRAMEAERNQENQEVYNLQDCCSLSDCRAIWNTSPPQIQMLAMPGFTEVESKILEKLVTPEDNPDGIKLCSDRSRVAIKKDTCLTPRQVGELFLSPRGTYLFALGRGVGGDFKYHFIKCEPRKFKGSDTRFTHGDIVVEKRGGPQLSNEHFFKSETQLRVLFGEQILTIDAWEKKVVETISLEDMYTDNVRRVRLVTGSHVACVTDAELFLYNVDTKSSHQVALRSDFGAQNCSMAVAASEDGQFVAVFSMDRNTKAGQLYRLNNQGLMEKVANFPVNLSYDIFHGCSLYTANAMELALSKNKRWCGIKQKNQITLIDLFSSKVYEKTSSFSVPIDLNHEHPRRFCFDPEKADMLNVDGYVLDLRKAWRVKECLFDNVEGDFNTKMQDGLARLKRVPVFRLLQRALVSGLWSSKKAVLSLTDEKLFERLSPSVQELLRDKLIDRAFVNRTDVPRSLFIASDKTLEFLAERMRNSSIGAAAAPAAQHVVNQWQNSPSHSDLTKQMLKRVCDGTSYDPEGSSLVSRQPVANNKQQPTSDMSKGETQNPRKRSGGALEEIHKLRRIGIEGALCKIEQREEDSKSAHSSEETSESEYDSEIEALNKELCVDLKAEESEEDEMILALDRELCEGIERKFE